MTNEKITIAVAKACGWNLVETRPFSGPTGFHDNVDKFARLPVPNYAEDLNACHEMEKSMDYFEWREWARLLSSMLNDDLPDYCDNINEAISAEPIKRCEAFLKFKGLWENKK